MDAAIAAMSAATLAETAPREPPWRAALPAARRVLTEAEAKAKLARFGLAVPRASRAGSPAEAAAAAARIGFPVVLKGEGFAHKTEAGAVALGLMDSDAVARAAEAMPAGTFLVEEQVTGAVAELLVGVVADPSSGYVLTLAAGGTLTEILSDRVSLLLPARDADLRAALSRLRIAPLLAGYRGRPAADIEAILAAIRAVQDYIAAHPGEIGEVEINPLICTDRRAVAADALIAKGDRT
jgi:succinyl-CoA synthetase beta subunit